MEKRFYSNGKLLITGEYSVLDGAKALALPTKYGQTLRVKNSGTEKSTWKSYDSDGSLWFDTEIAISEISQKKHSGSQFHDTLIDILNEINALNPVFFSDSGFEVITELSFPRNWGLGTSSTLINNIAQWTDTDAYQLLKKSFGGSGYDIACAQHNHPVLYHLESGKPIVEKVSFNPPFAENIWFVYLNQKQSSKSAIESYRNRSTGNLISQIDKLTSEAITAQTCEDFSKIIAEHESIMSDVLGLPAVKQKLFPDFDGTLKSLGAWGGDFIMAISEKDPGEYFRNKGYPTIVSFAEMIL